MTLGSEDRTGDTHGQMEMRFHGRLLRRPQRALWLKYTTVNNVVYEVEEQGGSQDSALGDA